MIYYSHINEDNQIERDLLSNSSCETIVAVGGSGERVLSLMDLDNCKRLMVVDINPCALFLLQLKITALIHLSVEDYLQFVGHNDLQSQKRIEKYKTLKTFLSSEAMHFWDHHLQDIGNGILLIGYFEKFLSRVRALILWFLGRNFHLMLCGGKVDRFPHRRWKIILKIFSYRFAYQLSGNNDIAFTGRRANLYQISRALDQMVDTGKAYSSFIFHLIFNGSLKQMAPEDLPPSVQPKILNRIKKRLMEDKVKIEYSTRDLNSFCKAILSQIEEPVFYSISDILSYSDFEYLQNIIQQVKNPASMLVGRGFVRNRLSSFELADLANQGIVQTYEEHESTLMYQVFSYRPKS